MENVRHTCAKVGLQGDIKKERLKPEPLSLYTHGESFFEII